MSDSVDITSAKNAKIVALRKLQQRKHRRAQGRFAVEGLQLISMALDAGFNPKEVFYCEPYFVGTVAPHLLQQSISMDARVYNVSPAVMQVISERDSPQGLVATFPLFEHSLDAIIEKFETPSLLLILDRLQDPGNLGTLVRTADAVAASGIVLIEPCVDLFDPKTVRGSMGSLFNIPIIRIPNPKLLFDKLSTLSMQLVGADGRFGVLPWGVEAEALQGTLGLVLGNEARGLSEDIRPHLSKWVRLPLFGGAESLNVAVAGGVLMYEWVRQNRP